MLCFSQHPDNTTPALCITASVMGKAHTCRFGKRVTSLLLFQDSLPGSLAMILWCQLAQPP